MLHRTTRPYEIALGTWARCKAGFFGFREVALAGPISQAAGWDVEALGFTRINVHGPMEVPRLTRLSLDLSSRYDTDFVAPKTKLATSCSEQVSRIRIPKHGGMPFTNGATP